MNIDKSCVLFYIAKATYIHYSIQGDIYFVITLAPLYRTTVLLKYSHRNVRRIISVGGRFLNFRNRHFHTLSSGKSIYPGFIELYYGLSLISLDKRGLNRDT